MCEMRMTGSQVTSIFEECDNDLTKKQLAYMIAESHIHVEAEEEVRSSRTHSLCSPFPSYFFCSACAELSGCRNSKKSLVIAC